MFLAVAMCSRKLYLLYNKRYSYIIYKFTRRVKTCIAIKALIICPRFLYTYTLQVVAADEEEETFEKRSVGLFPGGLGFSVKLNASVRRCSTRHWCTARKIRMYNTRDINYKIYIRPKLHNGTHYCRKGSFS